MAQANRNLGLTAATLGVFVAGMVGAAYAAVPLYKVFCQVTGFNGTTQRAQAAPKDVSDREITVLFDANVSNGLGWSFRPLQRSVTLKLGEVKTIDYQAENRTGETITGTAAFNIAPLEAGVYFNKIQCFCFSDQTLKPGQSGKLPVTFFVSPSLVENHDLDTTTTITLSYTFYPAKKAAGPVASAAAPGVTGG